MKILLIDATASFLDFALRCKDHGHQVRWFVADDKHGQHVSVGDGFKMRIPQWEGSISWADITLISDNARLIDDLTRFRNKGYPILAPSAALRDWELNRRIGQEMFEKAGLNTMPSEPFHNYDKAIEYVKDNMKRYVSKPDGDADKALSYVSNSPQDMVAMLERWKALPGAKRREFILQEFVPGIEMAVGGWCGPMGFNNFVLENFEFKKLMNDNLGPNTGEQGTAIKYVRKGASKLAKEVLLPFEDELVAKGYKGFIDVAVIVDENGSPRPLEFTTRPGWPLFNIQQALHPDPVEWMRDLVEGVDSFEPLTKHCVGVVMAIPHYPYSHLTHKELYGYPIYGLDDDNPLRDSLHPCELAWDKAPKQVGNDIAPTPMFVSAGDYLVVTTGVGDSIQTAQKGAYKACESIEIPNSVMYRTDIGNRLEKQLPVLHKQGFATEWEF